MTFDQAVTYFMPKEMRDNNTHPKYHEFRVVVSSALIAVPLLILFPVFLHWMHRPILGYLINNGLLVSMLFSSKYFGHYRIPMTITALVTYFIIYDWIQDSGLIYSSNITILHMYLLGAIWADKKFGGWAILTNLGMFVFIYEQTIHAGLATPVQSNLGPPEYALGMNCLITIFFGGFLAWQQYDQERDRAKIRALQDSKITLLDEAVKQRTDQLNTMRENIATDFHDETGNMLSAITRQAALLKQQLSADNAAQPIVDSIIYNSNALYASSKDFLWHLNHNSDEPKELFDYLTGYGQRYYNQFDIAFSSHAAECQSQQLDPMAALNVLFIFKEAMTNVVKHSGATEVELSMVCPHDHIQYILSDNGTWKAADQHAEHYGLSNMERRCVKNNFGFAILKDTSGTRIEVTVPVSPLNIS
ncbi:sensor histidine kinase [Pedobacter sp. PWIIR3]